MVRFLSLFFCHNLSLLVGLKFLKQSHRVKQATNTLCGTTRNLSLFLPLYLIQSRKLLSYLKLNPDLKSESKEKNEKSCGRKKKDTLSKLDCFCRLFFHRCDFFRFCMSKFELDLIFMYSWDERFILFPPLLRLRWLYLFAFLFISRDEKKKYKFTFCLKYSFALSLT